MNPPNGIVSSLTTERCLTQASCVSCSSGSQLGAILATGNIWQCLETFLVAQWEVTCYWHLMGKHPSMLLNIQQFTGQPTLPRNKGLPGLKFTVPQLGTPARQYPGQWKMKIWSEMKTNHTTSWFFSCNISMSQALTPNFHCRVISTNLGFLFKKLLPAIIIVKIRGNIFFL